MRASHWILDEHGLPVPCESVSEWSAWMDRHALDRSCVIAQDRDEKGRTDILVSTIFLGRDHSFGFGDEPILFETMILGGLLDGYQERYVTRDDALIGHQRACERMRESLSRRAIGGV